MKIKNIVFCFCALLLLSPNKSFSQINSIFNLPEKKETKPWTYWWWQGSAVDSTNITYNLQEFAKAGIGGVHIIPIYGVKGYEKKFINFLSPEWMNMLAFTSEECTRLGLGLDMTLGTGWPFGGPNVTNENSSCRLIDTVFSVEKNSGININLRDLLKKRTYNEANVKLIAVKAYYNDTCFDLIKYVDEENNLKWSNSHQEAKIVVLFLENSIQQVKRAAPGGKGNVLNPFSVKSINNYLNTFTNAFNSYNGKPVRAFYHDSYEYFGADWSPELPEEFIKRRGYNLLDELPSLIGNSDSEKSVRIKCDYRATIAEMHEEFIRKANEWSLEKNALFRCQAHGAPANLLDVYAASSIPETEVFGTPKTFISGLNIDTVFSRKETVDPLVMKFASSAAHIANKNLVSSETGTWLTEHFQEKLSLVKPEVDQLLVSGINHIFFHGIPYSPKDETWPGWQFYASTNFGPSNSLWHNLPELTGYITRCQTVLQQGSPDNNLLLYFPIWDLWNNKAEGLIYLQMHNPEAWLFNTNFYNTAKELSNKGYSYDYISDNQIKNLTSEKGEILADKIKYKAILIPACKQIPIETLERLNELSKKGAKVFFADSMPTGVPGYYKYQQKNEQLRKLSIELINNRTNVFVGSLEAITGQLPLINESGFAKHNLNFIKRKTDSCSYYFIVNQTENEICDWIEISEKCNSVILNNPINNRSGKGKIKKTDDGKIAVFIQIKSGESLILKTSDGLQDAASWLYTERLNEEYEIKGEWNIEFINGGPILPKPQRIKQLTSWTNFANDECKKFFGTAIYKIEFSNPNPKIKTWMLDLGKVCESARVKINNNYIGAVWAFPFEINLNSVLKEGKNVLEIEITNCAANRIKDLDKNGSNWKKFYDINFVNINYKKFDASGWDYVNSGLLGPVKLIPLGSVK